MAKRLNHDCLGIAIIWALVKGDAQETEVKPMRPLLIPMTLIMAAALTLCACTDPYDPGQRAVGGGLLGAGAGAAIGGVAGGGRGAVAGALIGGAAGAIGGAATTPQRPPQQGYYDQGYQQPPGYRPAY